jgi:multidrug resistance efflux pump
MKRLIPIIILLAALGAGYYWWPIRPSTAAAPELTPLVGSGTIEAETVAITAELGGRILEIKVDEGDEVKAGQLLVELDKAALLARATQLEAALTTAKVNLELVSASARPEEVAAAQAALNQAKVAQSGAALTWDRAQKLVNDPHALEAQINQAKAEVTGAQSNLEMAQVQLKRMEIQAEAASRNQSDHAALVQNETAQHRLQSAQVGVQMAEVALAGARQQVEHLVQIRDRPLQLIAQANAARAVYSQAEAGVLAAQANLAVVKAGPIPEDIAIAQAQVAEAEAALATVKTQLAKQTLAAPRAGLISQKLVNPGELATPGSTLLELSDIETVDLVVYIPETQIGRVKIGHKALVYVDAYDQDTFEGRVSFIAHEAEFTPRNVQTQEERVNLVFAVKITLDNADHRLKPGMPADAEILPEMVADEAITASSEADDKAASFNAPDIAPSPTSSPSDKQAPSPTPTPLVRTTVVTPTVTTATEAQAEILAWAIKVRRGPGVDYPAFAHLAQGQIVPVLKVDPATGWLQVRFEGPAGETTGWISGNQELVRKE